MLGEILLGIAIGLILGGAILPWVVDDRENENDSH